MLSEWIHSPGIYEVKVLLNGQVSLKLTSFRQVNHRGTTTASLLGQLNPYPSQSLTEECIPKSWEFVRQYGVMDGCCLLTESVNVFPSFSFSVKCNKFVSVLPVPNSPEHPVRRVHLPTFCHVVQKNRCKNPFLRRRPKKKEKRENTQLRFVFLTVIRWSRVTFKFDST